jgi:hypothetical protein
VNKEMAKKVKIFNKRLVLNQWLIERVFGKASFDELSENLKKEELETLDADGVTQIYYHLRTLLNENSLINAAKLLNYDQNIVRHTKKLNQNRGENIRWKYFQYLSLLFTEIFLDFWANDETFFLDELNSFLGEFNAKNDDVISEFSAEDIRKIAFWNATGSGKTLLMHVNLWQIQSYWTQKFPTKKFTHLILLTPTSNLSEQHLEEFQKSGIRATLFQKNSSKMFDESLVKIIEIYRFKETAKEKTIAISGFDGTNLVMVDEGHRGASGTEWKDYRERLAKDGFSFEYSATFGQAVNAATANNKEKLAQEYAKSILFDYSYKYFYRDGYGKDYRILNLPESPNDEILQEYLIASLLSFYQQLRIYGDQQQEIANYHISKPLWIFVGGKVNAEISDVEEIMLFFARFLSEKENTTRTIGKFLRGESNLLDSKSHNIFSRSFTYLVKQNEPAEVVYNDILTKLFNATANGLLKLENLSKAEGEVAVSVGESEPFGVINVGDEKKLLKRLEEKYPKTFLIKNRDFAESLFNCVNERNSKINLVIGSRKFSEGWNSWRVSTMGLMRIGQGEGSQIIQLFGRGVRLKGYGKSLKRSSSWTLANRPQNLSELETLQVFGLKADYMERFKEYLKAEELPTENFVEYILPIFTKQNWQNKLQIIKPKADKDFRKIPFKLTSDVSSWQEKNTIKLDLFPKLQAVQAKDSTLVNTTRTIISLEKHNLLMLDYNQICLELRSFVQSKGWLNLQVERAEIVKLLENPNWYELTAPNVLFNSPQNWQSIKFWNEIAMTLLRKYCESFYKQKAKELAEYEYAELQTDDKNFVGEYTVKVLVKDDYEDILSKLDILKTWVEKRRQVIEDKQIPPTNIDTIFKDGKWNYQTIWALKLENHLYLPLISLENKDLIKISPVELNSGERKFVEDLYKHLETERDYFADKEVFLLRNQPRTGIGFIEADNFYPDFILWLIVKGKQFIVFLDPKGLRNLEGLDDTKITFFKTIKEIESKIKQSNLTLDYFTLSDTPKNKIQWAKHLSNQDFQANHVLFLDEKDYLKTLFAMIEK